MIGNMLNYLFRSTRGLVLVAMSMLALVAAVWGTLSGPMAELGIREIVVDLLGFDLKPSERQGRLVLLYHSIALTVVAIEVYFITDIVAMKDYMKRFINGTVTAGYMLVLIFGLLFGYFGHNWLSHGLFVFGQALLFFGGILLAIALNPWNKEYRCTDNEYSHTKKGMDLERMAFFTLAWCTLGSALFGAAAGAYFGNGFEAFLAENTIRYPNKNPLDLAVIGHLHIMLALVAVGITLVIGRWLDFKGIFHKIAMPCMIVGTFILTLGVWTVVPWKATAHIIIYVGSVFAMWAALMLVIFGWRKITKERLAEQGIEKASFVQGLKALFHDPLKFGALWQMVFMNFNCSFVGIFLAVNLDKIFRIWPWREERITLSGHWHILSTLIASIILMYYADKMGMKGKVRQWFGWILIIGTDIAFASASLFSFKRLTMTEFGQQTYVDNLMILMDIGLGVTMVLLAGFLVWRLIDLFKKDGSWKKDLEEIEREGE